MKYQFWGHFTTFIRISDVNFIFLCHLWCITTQTDLEMAILNFLTFGILF